MDDDLINDLDDAIIEDTVHCCVCGVPCVLGGNDCVLLDGAKRRFTDHCNGAFCVECAAAVARAYREFLREMCVCEHGIEDGEYCEACREEYRRAWIENSLVTGDGG